MTLTRLNRFYSLYLWRTHYVCRCGAFLPKDGRELHEQFHAAAREFFQPPTGNDLAWIRQALEAQPTPKTETPR